MWVKPRPRKSGNSWSRRRFEDLHWPGVEYDVSGSARNWSLLERTAAVVSRSEPCIETRNEVRGRDT